MRGLEKIKEQVKKERVMKCGDFVFKIDYFDEGGKIRVDLFSDIAESLVKKCFDPNLKFDYDVYKMDKEGNFECKKPLEKNAKKIWKSKDCPKENRKKEVRHLTLNQIRKFYNEFLNYKTQIENAEKKEEKY